MNYYPGLFDKYKNEPKIDNWKDFANTMWNLGFDMDCYESFNKYVSTSNIKTSKPDSLRKEKQNTLYYLEHANKQIIGNYLFSYWRYLTHWAMKYNEYDYDFLVRIITILESKYI